MGIKADQLCQLTTHEKNKEDELSLEDTNSLSFT